MLQLGAEWAEEISHLFVLSASFPPLAYFSLRAFWHSPFPTFFYLPFTMQGPLIWRHGLADDPGDLKE